MVVAPPSWFPGTGLVIGSPKEDMLSSGSSVLGE